MRPYSELTQENFAKHPVWELRLETEERDETWVVPVSSLPVTDLGGRVVGAILHLASGRPALIIVLAKEA